MANDKFMIDGVRTMSGWEEYAEGKVGIEADFGKYCKPGDFVSQDIYDYFLNILPPVSMKIDYLQAGGEIMTAYNRETESYEPTYMTFVCTLMNGVYEFCGYCFKGQKDDVSAYTNYESVNDFLKKTYVDRGMFYNKRPQIKCNDGFEFSVQVGEIYYSTPRKDGNDIEYTHCEVGYPNAYEVALEPYIEVENGVPTASVYPYVPVKVIDWIVKKHGGFYVAVMQ